MSLENKDAGWLKRGRQRAAVAQVLRKPMITSQICAAARSLAPQIQLRDIWFLMHQFQERGLVACLNPRMVTGKLYCLTDRGRTAVKAVFALDIEPPNPSVDWRRYAWVVRAKVRKRLLIELAQWPVSKPATASAIRKKLNEKHPMGLNQTIRALKELERLGLVQSDRALEGPVHKTYYVTKKGRAIGEQLTL